MVRQVSSNTPSIPPAVSRPSAQLLELSNDVATAVEPVFHQLSHPPRPTKKIPPVTRKS